MNKRLIISVAKQLGDPSDLFFEEDLTEGGTGLVTYRNLEWRREKSNECVRERRFSFYYAAQAFVDKCKTFDRDKNSPSHENRDILIGHPYGITTEDLLVVVHIKVLGSGKYHIISAFEAEAGSWYEDHYEMNKNLIRQVGKRDHRKPRLRNPHNKRGGSGK